MAKEKTKKQFDPLIAVAMKSHFYRSSYRRILVVLVVSLGLNVLFGGCFTYLVLNPLTPVYFATTLEGRILPIFPIDEPNRSNGEILTWAQNAAMAAFTYNYTNYRQEFQASSDFFTPWGWTRFLLAIKASNNLDAVIYKKLVVSAQIPPNLESKIEDKGRVKGPDGLMHYAWKVQIPLVVTYQSTSEFSQQKTLVTLTVVRQTTLNSPMGLGIELFVVSPR